jgi:hypothetical protein
MQQTKSTSNEDFLTRYTKNALVGVVTVAGFTNMFVAAHELTGLEVPKGKFDIVQPDEVRNREPDGENLGMRRQSNSLREMESHRGRRP